MTNCGFTRSGERKGPTKRGERRKRAVAIDFSIYLSSGCDTEI